MGPFGYDSNQVERRGRRGCGFNFAAALVIVAFALFSYFTSTEKNPITGQEQRVAITPEQEIRLGLQSAPEMAAQMGGEVSANDPEVQEIQRVGRNIIQKSQAHKGPWQFHFHLLADSKTVNAFALPGGQIFITKGLLNRLQNESQLAGVLAHEIGHVIQRHSAQQMAKHQLGQMLVLATGVGASDSDRGYQAAMIANLVNQMVQLRYSRTDELEADLWGLQLMEQSGYDPRSMLEVMRILAKASPGGKPPEMLLTHPYPEKRIERIDAYLKEHPPRSSVSKGRQYRVSQSD